MNAALVGIGGYGWTYAAIFHEIAPKHNIHLVGAVEPYPELSGDSLDLIHEMKTPLYKSLDELYAHTHPDLVVLCVPIPLHKPQALYCFEKGSNVLCEKPLTATVQDALDLKAASERTGMKLGVGFQWSYCTPIRALKKDILSGLYGRPLFFKTHISWPRPETYYAKSSWKGRRHNASGENVNDCILSNATAHYLHNMFFLNGSSMETSAMPVSLRGKLQRVYPIETFDTCYVEGEMENGCKFLHIASHTASRQMDPRFEYRFEKGTVYFDENVDEIVYGVLKDGTKKVYGDPSTFEQVAQKVVLMSEAVEKDEAPCCGVDTILPHLTTCVSLLDQVPVEDCPADLLRKYDKDGSSYWYREGSLEETTRYYDAETVPGDATQVDLSKVR